MFNFSLFSKDLTFDLHSVTLQS